MLSPLSAFLIPRRLQILWKTVCIEKTKFKLLLEQYWSELPAETVVGDEFLMPAVIISSSDLPTQWKTFRRYITNQPREDTKEQLKELSTNSMMQTMFPNLSILANVCQTIPVGTTSVERSFSHMKMVKPQLRN